MSKRQIRTDLVESVKSRIAKGVYSVDDLAGDDRVLLPLLRAMRECKSGDLNERVIGTALMQFEDRLG